MNKQEKTAPLGSAEPWSRKERVPAALKQMFSDKRWKR